MPTAEEVLSTTYGRFMKNWSFIQSQRQVANVAIPIAQEALARCHADLIELMSTDPDYKKLIVAKDGSEAEWGDDLKELFSVGMTDMSMANFTAAIDGSSIIFAQSVLDDCALSLLQVCALAAPEDWEQYVNARKVDFTTIKGKSADIIRQELITEKLDQLGRESLKKKIDILFALTQPPDDFAPVVNYKFDMARIEHIDKIRQDIVHRDGMGQQLTEVEGDLQYVKRSVSFLIALVNQKYGVKIDPRIAFPVLAAQDKG